MDLENDNQFADLDVELVSVAFDSPEVLAASGAEFGVGPTPLLSDPDGSISEAYDVLQWAVGTGEPGHTFVLVDQSGKVAWIQYALDPGLVLDGCAGVGQVGPW